MPKVVFITGGSSGIGKAIGEYLSNIGYIVYGTSRNPSNNSEKLPFPLLTMDVSHVDSIEKAVSTIIKKEGSLDVVVNNAGVGITGPLEETPNSEIRN